MPKDLVPFTISEMLNFPDFRKPSEYRAEIRTAFLRKMEELFGVKESEFRSIPIPNILTGLAKVCTDFEGKIDKGIIRIELQDYYKLAGIRVTHDGRIRFDY